MWLDDVPGVHNPADIFTKGPSASLPVHRFQVLRDVVMGRQPEMYLGTNVEKLMRETPAQVNELLGQVRKWQSE